MIHPSISHAASAVTAPLSPASGHALQETDLSARHTPAAWVELSAEARGRSHAPSAYATRAEEARAEKSKSSDPSKQQVLWSKDLWKSNPSGVPETYSPPKRLKPSPLRQVARTEVAAQEAAPRPERPERQRRAERAVRNRERLQAYEASKRQPESTGRVDHETQTAIEKDRDEEASRPEAKPAKLSTSRRGQRSEGISRYARD